VLDFEPGVLYRLVNPFRLLLVRRLVILASNLMKVRLEGLVLRKPLILPVECRPLVGLSFRIFCSDKLLPLLTVITSQFGCENRRDKPVFVGLEGAYLPFACDNNFYRDRLTRRRLSPGTFSTTAAYLQPDAVSGAWLARHNLVGINVGIGDACCDSIHR
jgi:hypothetical protein